MSIHLQWPIDDIIAYAKRYAVTHGLLSLVADNLDYATIVPFSLYPSPYSFSHFQFIWSIQRDYNRLYQRLSLDDETLEKALTPVLPLDDFVSRLWKIHRTTRQHQPIQLDIYRSESNEMNVDFDFVCFCSQTIICWTQKSIECVKSNLIRSVRRSQV